MNGKINHRIFWYNKVGLNKEKLKFRDQDPDELAHYAKATTDVEYQFPRGWGELQWLAYRTDFDLKQHQEFSKKDMQYHDPHTGKRYVPHVIEPSFGLSRTVLATMLDAYEEEDYTGADGNTQTRVVARFHKNVAPIKFCIIPLVKKNEEMVKIAKDLYKKLAQDYMCEYDDSGNIGKCYRRQDEIGTPYCVTIDHQTLEDGTVTVRERDSMGQERMKIEDVKL
jgi:glycyl-tRNA synthetase